MTLTNYPDGVSSFGIPVIPGGPFKPWATYYFVDASNFSQAASDGNTGLSPEEPLLTMERAFELIRSGDVITFIGNVAEQLVTPAGIFDVTVLGAGNFPRNADTFGTTGQGYTSATWKAPAIPVTTQALCRILQQGWTFQNILFNPASAGAGLEFVRNAAAGSLERDASWGTVASCRFAGGLHHVQAGAASFAENLFGLRLLGNVFNDATGASVFQGAGGTWRAQLLDNVFSGNESNIDLVATQCAIARNEIGLFTTLGIDTSGGANNMVGPMNVFSGTYSNVGGYVDNASDIWAGNVVEAGITTADPG